MRFLERIFAAAVAMTFPVTAIAYGHGSIIPTVARDSVRYTGSWPATVSHAARGNGTYCLTLKDTGSQGWRHSGSASLTGNGSNQPYGTFEIIDHILVATIQQPGYSQNAGLLFIGPANGGSIGKGVFEQVYGGEDFDSGELEFGSKGGC